MLTSRATILDRRGPGLLNNGPGGPSAAARHGDLEALLAVLAPDVVRRADRAALPPGGATVVRGADAVARQAMVPGPRARFAEPALVNGAVGAVVAPHGWLRLVLAVTVRDGLTAGYDVIADRARLNQLDLAVLDQDS